MIKISCLPENYLEKKKVINNNYADLKLQFLKIISINVLFFNNF